MHSILSEERLTSVLQYMEDNDIQISCTTETWFDAQIGRFTGMIKEAGYDIVHANRDDKRGGGVAILFKIALKVKKGESSTSKFTSFECIVQMSHSKVLLQFQHIPR